jgi:glycosyltransferase involved in cell wall biosynthesis
MSSRDIFKVSVIIPVYNAVRFVRNAVESAVRLDEVGEILLVDDGYPDNAKEICKGLANEFPKVKFLEHPNGENRGAGASRNLGIANATCDFIAFLDADDWYFPNRFKKDKELFESDPTIDGVHGLTQSVLDRNGDLEYLDEYSGVRGNYDELTIQLGWLTGTLGAFTTNAITIRKSLLKKTGLFDTSLRLHQDSHLYYRFLWYGKIVAGEVSEPIATRRKHPGNRIIHKNQESKFRYYRKLFESYENVPKPDKRVYRKLMNRYVGTFKKKPIDIFFFRLQLLLSKPDRLKKFIGI